MIEDNNNPMRKKGLISYEVVQEYRKRALALETMGSDVVVWRYKLARELQLEYGVTQLEAINILNGHNVGDYIQKYESIGNGEYANKRKQLSEEEAFAKRYEEIRMKKPFKRTKQ